MANNMPYALGLEGIAFSISVTFFVGFSMLMCDFVHAHSRRFACGLVPVMSMVVFLTSPESIRIAAAIVTLTAFLAEYFAFSRLYRKGLFLASAVISNFFASSIDSVMFSFARNMDFHNYYVLVALCVIPMSFVFMNRANAATSSFLASLFASFIIIYYSGELHMSHSSGLYAEWWGLEGHMLWLVDRGTVIAYKSSASVLAAYSYWLFAKGHHKEI